MPVAFFYTALKRMETTNETEIFLIINSNCYIHVGFPATFILVSYTGSTCILLFWFPTERLISPGKLDKELVLKKPSTRLNQNFFGQPSAKGEAL